MSWTPGVGVAVTIGFTVGYKESVGLAVNRADEVAYLSIGRNVAEIRLEPNHLEMLRDQLPGVLADLKVLAAAAARVEEAGGRAEELELGLRDRADVADAAGEPERAGEMRGTADTLKTAVAALDLALDDVSAAARAADSASEDAQALLDKQIPRERSAGDQPATAEVGP